MVTKGRVGSSRVCAEGHPIEKKKQKRWDIVVGKVESREFTHGIVDFDFLLRYGILVENDLLDIVFVQGDLLFAFLFCNVRLGLYNFFGILAHR